MTDKTPPAAPPPAPQDRPDPAERPAAPQAPAHPPLAAQSPPAAGAQAAPAAPPHTPEEPYGLRMTQPQTPQQPVPGQGWPPAQAPYPPVQPAYAGGAPGGGAAFTRILLSEWTKIRTVRSTMWTLLVMVALIIGISLLVGGTVHPGAGDGLVSMSLIGVMIAQIAAATLGVLTMSAEYTTGMIRTTLTAYPRRISMLAAKGVVFALLMFVVGVVAIAVAAVLGHALLSGKVDSTADESMFRPVVGGALYLAVIGLFGLGMGALLRHSAGAITALLGIILLPTIIGPLVGNAVGEAIVDYSPMAVLLEVIVGSNEGGGDGLGAWSGLLLLTGYAAVALVAGAVRLKGTDV